MCLKWVFRSFRCGSIVCENRNNGEGYVKNWHAYRGRVGVNRNGRFSAAPGRGWRVVNFGRSSRTSSEKSLRRIWKPYDFPTLIAVIRVCQTKRRNVPPNAPQKTAKIKRTNQRPGKHYTGIDRRSRYIYICPKYICYMCGYRDRANSPRFRFGRYRGRWLPRGRFIPNRKPHFTSHSKSLLRSKVVRFGFATASIVDCGV